MSEKADESQQLTPPLEADSDEDNVKPGSTSSMSEREENDHTKKRNRSEEEVIFPEDVAKMSRSERKKHREKKRRSEVNKGFDELMCLLLEIDPQVRAEAEEKARRGQWKGSLGAAEDNVLSRVDLIFRGVEVLRRVHLENEQRKLIIAQLTGRTTRNSNEVRPIVISFLHLSPSSGWNPTLHSLASQVAMMLPMLQPVGPPQSSISQKLFYPGLGQLSVNDPGAPAGLLEQSAFPLPLSGSPALPPGEFLGFTGTGMQLTGGGVPLDAGAARLQAAAARLSGGGFGGQPYAGLGSLP